MAIIQHSNNQDIYFLVSLHEFNVKRFFYERKHKTWKMKQCLNGQLSQY